MRALFERVWDQDRRELARVFARSSGIPALRRPSYNTLARLDAGWTPALCGVVRLKCSDRLELPGGGQREVALSASRASVS